MYSKEQMQKAYLAGVEVGLECSASGLRPKAAGHYAIAKMDEMLDSVVAPELHDTDRVEAIL